MSGRARRFRLKRFLATRLWIAPLLCLIAGIALALVTLAIDRGNDYGLVSQRVTGTPTDVQTILSTAATALVTLTSVVLSLTLVTIQLAMGQFSPRIVRALLSDRRNQFAIGLFIATFAYTVLVIREVDDSSSSGAVPGLSVLVAYGLVLASIVSLVLFVHHAGQSIRVSGLIDLVGDNTRVEIERMYPEMAEGLPQPDLERHVIRAPDSGVVVTLHHEGLVAVAADAGCVLEMVPAMGEFVPRGAPLFRVHDGELSPSQRATAIAYVVLGPERTHKHDPSYGIRKLVDIAERTIASSPFDDPTTSVQALHRIRDCMRQLATRQFPSGQLRDAQGELRLTLPVLDWDAYVRLAFDEIRLVGCGSPQVARALRATLEDVRSVAPEERHGPLDRQLELLDAAIRRSYDDDADVRAAMAPDPLGIGAGPDLIGRSNGHAASSGAQRAGRPAT